MSTTIATVRQAISRRVGRFTARVGPGDPVRPAPALAQEALELAGEHVAGGEVVGVRLLLLLGGGALEALDERLHVGVGLDGAVDLALVLAGGRLELGGVDGDADDPSSLRTSASAPLGFGATAT